MTGECNVRELDEDSLCLAPRGGYPYLTVDFQKAASRVLEEVVGVAEDELPGTMTKEGGIYQ
jgi:hypothetical protein